MPNRLVFGSMTISPSDPERLIVNLIPKRGRHVFAADTFANCRINFGLDETPCLWVGSVAFDLTHREAARLTKEYPTIRRCGIPRAETPRKPPKRANPAVDAFMRGEGEGCPS